MPVSCAINGCKSRGYCSSGEENIALKIAFHRQVFYHWPRFKCPLSNLQIIYIVNNKPHNCTPSKNWYCLQR